MHMSSNSTYSQCVEQNKWFSLGIHNKKEVPLYFRYIPIMRSFFLVGQYKSMALAHQHPGLFTPLQVLDISKLSQFNLQEELINLIDVKLHKKLKV